MRKRLMTFGAVAMALALVAAGCDDDDNGNEAAGGGDVQAYCDLSAQLDEQDGPPTAEQIQELAEAAPDEISEEIQFVADRFLEDGPSVFGDPDVGQRFEVIEEYEVDACGREPEDDEEGSGDPEPAAGAEVVEVVGTEYAFEGVPETLPAGPVAFRLTNEGEEEHELSLGKLVEGKTMEDVLAAEGDPVEAGVVEELLGDVWAPAGQASGYLNVELEAGTYGFVCFVPSAEDGQPHAAHGMTATFTVA